MAAEILISIPRRSISDINALQRRIETLKFIREQDQSVNVDLLKIDEILLDELTSGAANEE